MKKGRLRKRPFFREPVEAFVEALASRAPAPGGGSAAALAGALGAALLGKVGRIVLARSSGAAGARGVRPPWHRRIRSAAAACDRQRRALLRLMEADARAYERLVALLRLHPQRRSSFDKAQDERYRMAQRQALEVPLAICERTVEVLRHARILTPAAGRGLASDVTAGVALLTGGFAAAAATVTANLDGLGDAPQAVSIRRKLQVLTRGAEPGSQWER